jgi:O-antigen ligase
MSASDMTYTEATRERHGGRPLRDIAWPAAAVLSGLLVAYLIARGLWFAVPPILLLVPAFVVVHRYPMAAVSLWIVATPLLVVTNNAGVRVGFTLVHRVLPPVTLLVIILSSALGIRPRRLPRLGWPEAVMGCYVVATLLSIAFRSATPMASTIIMYDRIVAPMFLYLIVRLLEPTDQQLRRLLPAVAFVIVSQTAFGILQWAAPGVLPSAWLALAGLRTTGSLDDPNVFGSTLIFCAMFALMAALVVPRRAVPRIAWLALFAVAMFDVFFTFGRADWLAGILTFAGCSLIYRGFGKWLLGILIPGALVLVASGVVATQIHYAEHRFRSDQSVEEALSRLPVVFAAVRMFEAKPLVGWGYEEFDRYSRSFQSRVGNLVYPVKPHASHNLYLSLLAEQGLIGFLLFVVPTLIWLVRSRRIARAMPARGFVSRPALWSLWIAILGFYLVNNFAVMHVSSGLGLWWLTLGVIASLVARTRRAEDEAVGATQRSAG